MMIQEIEVHESAKSYANAKNLRIQLDRLLANQPAEKEALRYLIVQREDGRVSPVFINSIPLNMNMYLVHKGFTVVG